MEPFMSDIRDDMGASAGLEDTRRVDLERQASSLAERARMRVEATIEPIKDKAKEFAEAGKQGGADKIGGVAAAVRRAAGDLEADLPRAAGYVRQAADTMERASATLRERSLDELVASVGRFARCQPAAFFGAAVLAGFALSRFIKSSAEH
jgi:hypothetical protein